MRLAVPVYVGGPGAARRRGALRRRPQRRAPLAEPRLHHDPALGDHEDRRAARCSRGTSTATRKGLRMRDFAVAAILLALPVGLIVRQPDLGTALLIFASGFFVIFLAGLSWKVHRLAWCVAGAASLPFLWSMLHDYQRQRILTLLDPIAGSARRGLPHHPVDHRDRLRRHPRQGLAERHPGAARLRARALHRLHPRGVRRGVRPRRATSLLIVLYLLIIARGLMIAANASTIFSRLRGRRRSRSPSSPTRSSTWAW